MGISEGLSDDGTLTGRGDSLTRGAITGITTFNRRQPPRAAVPDQRRGPPRSPSPIRWSAASWSRSLDQAPLPTRAAGALAGPGHPRRGDGRRGGRRGGPGVEPLTAPASFGAKAPHPNNRRTAARRVPILAAAFRRARRSMGAARSDGNQELKTHAVEPASPPPRRWRSPRRPRSRERAALRGHDRRGAFARAPTGEAGTTRPPLPLRGRRDLSAPLDRPAAALRRPDPGSPNLTNKKSATTTIETRPSG